MNTIFPEYRGVSLVTGRAQVNRKAGPAGQPELDQALAGAKANGFVGDPPMRPPFAMEQKLDGNTLVQEVRLALSPDELGRILSAPAAMTSEAIAHWLPKVAPRQYEDFELEVIWVAMDEARADFLINQLTEGALGVGWKCEQCPSGWPAKGVDGGPRMPLPLEASLVLRHAQLGASLAVDRKAQRAKLHYRLVTFERR